MAVITVSNTGGNWNVGSTWVGGVVPLSTDSIAFTATSGNLTINVTNLTIAGIDFTNYVGTITFTNSLNISGSLNLGTGGYTQAGANGLIFTANTTITSNGVVWSRTVRLNNGTIVLTLNDDFNISGAFSATGLLGALTLSFAGVGQFLPTGSFTVSDGSVTGAATITITLPNDISISSFIYAAQGSGANGRSIVLNGSKNINVSGSIAIIGNASLGFSGTCILVATGSGNFTVGNTTSGLNPTLTLHIKIAASGTYTFFNWPIFSGPVTYLSGTLAGVPCYFGGATCTLDLNAGGKWGTDVILRGAVALTSNATFGNLTTQTTAVTLSGAFTVNVEGNLTVNIGTSGASTPMVLNGTGAQTWSGTSTLSSNLTINKASGTLTVSGTVSYNTGTLTYTAGTVSTTGSTLAITGSCTLTTNGIIWNNLSVTAASTITLGSNLKVLTTFTSGAAGTGFAVTITPGIYSVDFSTATVNIGTGSNLSQSFTYNGTITCTNFQASAGNTYTTTLNGTTFNVTGNFTLTSQGTGGGTLTGTSSFNFIGTGTIQQTSSTTTSIPITNSININSPSGTITFASGTNLWYQTGTLTYTAGTVVTTNFGLVINGTATLNTNGSSSTSATTTSSTGINWNNVSVAAGTITNNSNFTVVGTLTFFSSNSVINGSTFYLNGSLTTTTSPSGTALLLLQGTGTWSGAGAVRNNMTINTAGTITISGSVAYNTGTLTYTAGTVITTGASLTIAASTTLDTSVISWPALTVSASSTITLLSTFTVLNTVTIPSSVALTIVSTDNNVNFFTADMSLASIASLTYNGTLTCNNLQLTAGNTYNQTLNGTTLNIRGNLTANSAGAGGGSVIGTSTLVLVGTGTISTAVVINNNMVINSKGRITLQGTIFYQTGTFTYLSGTIISKNATFYLTSAATCINLNNAPFENVLIASGATVTMNEFFCGTSSIKTKINPSSTTNYTITFQDGFEKVAKFVEISNCTLAKPQQLLVLGDTRAKGTNRGIRYTNQSPNGLSKNIGKTLPSLTFDTGGILPDPNFVKLK